MSFRSTIRGEIRMTINGLQAIAAGHAKPISSEDAIEALLHRLDQHLGYEKRQQDAFNRIALSGGNPVYCTACGRVCETGGAYPNAVDLRSTRTGKRIDGLLVLCEECNEDEDAIDNMDQYLSEAHAHEEMAEICAAFAWHYYRKDKHAWVCFMLQMIEDMGKTVPSCWVKGESPDKHGNVGLTWVHRRELL